MVSGEVIVKIIKIARKLTESEQSLKTLNGALVDFCIYAGINFLQNLAIEASFGQRIYSPKFLIYPNRRTQTSVQQLNSLRFSLLSLN